MLVIGRLSIGLYAAAFAAALGFQVDYVDTDPHRLAAAEKLGAVAHDIAKPDKSWEPYPVTVHTSADPSLLSATLRATWPDGVCTDTGIYYQPTSRCRCCRCTPAAFGSSPGGSVRAP